MLKPLAACITAALSLSLVVGIGVGDVVGIVWVCVDKICG